VLATATRACVECAKQTCGVDDRARRRGQHIAAPGREKIHDNVVVRWGYCPDAFGVQCAPVYDEFAPASGTRER